MIPAPAPGIYFAIPAEEYHQWDALSNSMCSLLLKSPLALWDYIHNGSESKRVYEVGTPTHLEVLEPNRLERGFAVAGQCEAVTGKGERCSKSGSALVLGKWFCGVHHKGGSDKGVLTADEYDTIRRMRDAVHSHPVAGPLVRKATSRTTEVSLVWVCRITGALCKARLDLACFDEDMMFLADLKTCRDASPREFEKSIFTYGYYRQAAHYLDGARTLGFEMPGFVNIAVEKSRPHHVACYWQKQDVIELGLGQLISLRNKYATCRATDNWPGLSERIVEIGIPNWAKALIESEAA